MQTNIPAGLKRLRAARSPVLLIDFGGGRLATMHHFGWECPFTLAVKYQDGSSKIVKAESDFFAAFIQNLVRFFESGKPAVQPEDTIAVITLIEYGTKAANTPFQWVELPV